MKEYKVHIPVSGALSLKIVAESPEDVLEIIESKLDRLLYHPNCILDPEYDRIIMYEVDDQNVNVN